MWVIESFGDGPRRKGDDKKRGFSGWSKSKAALDARILEAQGEALPAWTVHDIRRSAATAMADRLGVLPHIVEAVLNHVSGHRAGVAGIYNRARYAEEMRDALERWSEHVAAIVGDASRKLPPAHKFEASLGVEGSPDGTSGSERMNCFTSR
ncbi:hypothetical protein [Bradyrhizobium sp. CCBAU 11361]|uniref:hypothetical protein n=1 Tax=Bradyrhizobium sp. CCBAU 11361 TaxID=1630812 RepID=UPI00230318CB|nr:hypothetical protein [Bradyrhizobium sp. CCBAU 11361]MDA9490159.1 hypothetical protein [Bradyrhizobium sp. CCBAU 11361]